MCMYVKTYVYAYVYIYNIYAHMHTYTHTWTHTPSVLGMWTTPLLDHRGTVFDFSTYTNIILIKLHTIKHTLQKNTSKNYINMVKVDNLMFIIMHIKYIYIYINIHMWHICFCRGWNDNITSKLINYNSKSIFKQNLFTFVSDVIYIK